MTTSPAPPLDFDVIIVGAGLSGLSAGKVLKDHGVTSFAILEAHPTRTGGRNYCDAEGTDLGGAYFGPEQDRVINLIDELGLKLYKVNTEGKTVQNLRSVVSHFAGTIPPLSLIAMLDLNAAMIAMEKEIAAIPIESPHFATRAAYLDNMTVEEYLRKVCSTSDPRALVRTAIRAVFCQDPSQMSALFALWAFASGGGLSRVLETENGAQDSTVLLTQIADPNC